MWKVKGDWEVEAKNLPHNGGLEDSIFGEDFAFYLKPTKVFEQGNHMICLTF